MTYHNSPDDWFWWVGLILEDLMAIFFIVLGIAAWRIAKHVKRFADAVEGEYHQLEEERIANQ